MMPFEQVCLRLEISPKDGNQLKESRFNSGLQLKKANSKPNKFSFVKLKKPLKEVKNLNKTKRVKSKNSKISKVNLSCQSKVKVQI